MKIHVTVSIEDYIHEQARDKGINVSAICEDALRQIIETFDSATLPENCEHKWTWPFGTAMGLAKECKKCGHIKRVIIEDSDEEKMSQKFMKNLPPGFKFTK